jgi:hypothetical protein
LKWRAIPALLAAAALVAGCGDDGDDEPPAERADPPARTPAGWRTVRNAPAGFTIAVPKSWTARTKSAATLLRSKDKLVVITVAADRSDPGRELEPEDYARRTLEALPGFEGSVAPGTRRVRGSPYDTARVDGSGTVRTSRRPQRIAVAAYHRRLTVTYVAVVFRNPRVDPRVDERTVRRILRTLRARPPADGG